MLLKPKELQTQEVTLDGTVYTVQAMTIHKRTQFESALVHNGTEYIREAMLIFCVSVAGVPAFNPDEFLSAVDFDESGLTKDQIEQKTEEQAQFLLLDYLSGFPGDQLEPLVTAAQQVNGLLGNDSNPS